MSTYPGTSPTPWCGVLATRTSWGCIVSRTVAPLVGVHFRREYETIVRTAILELCTPTGTFTPVDKRCFFDAKFLNSTANEFDLVRHIMDPHTFPTCNVYSLAWRTRIVIINSNILQADQDM